MYAKKEDMCRWVAESQAAGAPTAELVEMVRRVTVGLIDRYRWQVDHDDAVQAATLRLILILPKLDPAKNCFGYVTQCVHNELRSIWGQEARQVRLRARLADRLGWRPEP